MSNTPNTAAIMVHSIRIGSWPMYSSVNGLMMGETPSFSLGWSCAMRAQMAPNSSFALFMLAPGLSRPITSYCSPSPHALASGLTSSGSHSRALVGKKNPFGITPTICRTTPLARMVFPTMSGSAPKRFCQSSHPMSTTGAAPGRLSSSLKSRPRRG